MLIKPYLGTVIQILVGGAQSVPRVHPAHAARQFRVIFKGGTGALLVSSKDLGPDTLGHLNSRPWWVLLGR